MILLDVDAVSVDRPDRPLFSDVSLTISAGDRIGVTGVNGVGKTTLLRVMADEQTPDRGEVRRGRDVTVVTLDQRPEFGDRTVRQVVGEGWEADAAIDRLDMTPHLDTPVSRLSGGQARRAALARAMVVPADLLILDEPTNHLDLDAIAWLEDHLAARTGGLVLVTHDRAFLDRVTTRMVAIEPGGAWFVHDGGYRSYLAAAADRARQAEADEASRRILARQESAWLARGARARRRKPKARIAFARSVIDGPEGTPTGGRDGALALGEFGATRLGRQVVELHDVSVGFPGHPPLVERLDLLLDNRARLGIIGTNGVGKSTLLDVVAGRREPLAGRVVRGSTVQVGYFDQHGTHLDADVRVRDAVAGPGNVVDHTHKALMERFWFGADVQYAPVGSLSGGERRRLELLMVLAARPNVLLLDEPTNDLDLDTLRALEEFLDDFAGALVTVSHDRAFLERVTEFVIAVEAGRAELLGGGDAVWQRGRSGRGRVGGSKPRRSGGRSGPAGQKRRSPSTLGRLIGTAEDRMAELGERQDALRARLTAGDADHLTLAAVGEELAAVDAELAAAEEEWLELSAELESLG